MVDELRRDEFELLARIAYRYYIDDRSQEEIAREFALSRPKVQRLLVQARASGVVDIHVQAPPWLNLDLERRLRERFGLREAIVCPSRTDPQSQREAVARSAARYLERLLADGTIVTVGHGRDAAELPRFFRPERRIGCVFVSAMGGSPRVDAPTNPNEICRALADACGGRSVSLYAPAYVESARLRDSLLGSDAVRHTLGEAARANVAVVGIGGTDDGATMVRAGCLSVAEMARLRERGAVGDVLGTYVDADGRLVAAAHAERLIALALDELRGIETVVAVVSEAEKPRAILGVLRADVIDVLVVDATNAGDVLDLAAATGGTPPSRPARRRPGGGERPAD